VAGEGMSALANALAKRIPAFGVLWRNREMLAPIAELLEQLLRAGLTVAEVRRRLADGIQRGDVVSDLALARVLKAHRAADAAAKERGR
jgi:hypothetical protein